MTVNVMAKQVADFIRDRATAKIEKFDKDADKERRKVGVENAVALADFEAKTVKDREELLLKYQPDVWLSDAASRAWQISMVTHAIKYTHGDAKGSSVLFETQDNSTNNDRECCVISTGSIQTSAIDVVGNAAALDVASLLKLSVDGETLIQQLAKNETGALIEFSKNTEQLSGWVDGFKEALKDKEVSSHKLAKQLYFPVGSGDYHLLSPLFATSLADVVYQKIINSRFSDEAKAVRKQKKDSKYSELNTVDYLNVATQTFGGTKPQNISQLNSSRGGKAFLFSAQPPQWTSQPRPPVKSGTAFWDSLVRERGVYRKLNSFRIYLENIEHRSSTQHYRDIRAGYVDDLIGLVLQYSAEIQLLPAGWSADCKLPNEECLWLDPYREDESFQLTRAENDWQEKISNRFGSWLNSHLNRGKSLVFSDTEAREWKDSIKRDLELCI